MTGTLWLALATGMLVNAAESESWTFDPNTLRLTGFGIEARLRPVGDMHGLVIEKMDGAGSPVAEGRAFLNLEHYLETGRHAEYLPRKLEHQVTMDRKHLTIRFPQPKEWPVVSELTYTFTRPRTVDAKLTCTFKGAMSQFEMYFTSYFAPQYERSIRVNGEWARPEISASEQLLIPRDDKVASRYTDGRWEFLKGRTRLADVRFDLPVMVSRDDQTGWTIVQMIEPGGCTHIAPNRFAVGHNFIIGGWDVQAGEQRSVRVRLIAGQNITDHQVQQAYQAFADDCRQAAPPPAQNPPAE